MPQGMAFGPPGGFRPGGFLVQPILQAADKDHDGKLSREELTAGAKALFKALDQKGKGELDEKAVAAGLDKLLPGPRGFGGPPPGPRGGPQGFPGPGAGLAKVIVARAGKDGKLTQAGLGAAADRFFMGADKNKDGQLDEQELGDALAKVIPAPRFDRDFGPGRFLARPILDAADKDKDGKLSRPELTAGAKALYKALDRQGKGKLDEKAVATGLDKLLPGPRGFPGPGAGLAKILLARAGKDGKLTEASLLTAVDKFFTDADRNKDGKLDEQELGDAINKFMPVPPFGPPRGGPFGPGPDGPRGPRPPQRPPQEGGR